MYVPMRMHTYISMCICQCMGVHMFIGARMCKCQNIIHMYICTRVCRTCLCKHTKMYMCTRLICLHTHLPQNDPKSSGPCRFIQRCRGRIEGGHMQL